MALRGAWRLGALTPSCFKQQGVGLEPLFRDYFSSEKYLMVRTIWLT